MAESKKLELDAGDVVRWGEAGELGVVEQIRIIDTSKFVKKFSGDGESVSLRIRTAIGTASVWPKLNPVEKVSDHDAKEFKSKIQRIAGGGPEEDADDDRRGEET